MELNHPLDVIRWYPTCNNDQEWGLHPPKMGKWVWFQAHSECVCVRGCGCGCGFRFVCVCVFNWIANSIRNGQICLKHVETKQANVFLSSHTPRLISHGLWCLCCASLLPLGEVSQVMFLPHSNKPHRALQYHGEIPCES